MRPRGVRERGKEGEKPEKGRLKERGGTRKGGGGAKTGNPAQTAKVLFCHWVAVTERASQERNNSERERETMIGCQ